MQCAIQDFWALFGRYSVKKSIYAGAKKCVLCEQSLKCRNLDDASAEGEQSVVL